MAFSISHQKGIKKAKTGDEQLVFFFFLGTLNDALVVVVEVGRQGNQKEKRESVKAVFFFFSIHQLFFVFFVLFKRSLMSCIFFVLLFSV